MRIRAVVAKEILLILAFIAISFLFGYFMRNVRVPPDCVVVPEAALCGGGKK